MISKQTKKHLIAACFFSGITCNVLADTIDNPCAGLLSIVDRPTVGDSACAVPYKNVVMEFGYQYQQLSQGSHQQNFPEAEFRLGLPANNEFVVLLPNYIHQYGPSQTGYSATVVGLKHEIGYTEHWLGAMEGLFTLPSGSYDYGSDGMGTAVNGIISYTFNPQFNLNFMLGGSSQTLPVITQVSALIVLTLTWFLPGHPRIKLIFMAKFTDKAIPHLEKAVALIVMLVYCTCWQKMSL